MTVMRLPKLFVFVLLAASGCRADETESDTFRMPVPGRLVRALARVTELEAIATLVPRNGPSLGPVVLSAGTDGVSFSGFIPAEPGDYVLEVVFTGLVADIEERGFLGRLTSDQFTVSAGGTATPVFSTPLDPIGRPGDGGDEDDDGLGLIDEVLWSTNPRLADTDEDGLRDGEDCDPGDGNRSFSIAVGGSLEDCDGDGVLRPDLPYANGGDDCDDRDSDVRPGAIDDCEDPRDLDCNPSTCPGIDTLRPEIRDIEPPSGSVLGCQATISASLSDNVRVQSASVVLDGIVGGQIRTLFMQNENGDLWRSSPLSTLGSGIATGWVFGKIVASDPAGNIVGEEVSFEIVLSPPAVQEMLPERLTSEAKPFEVRISATAKDGLDEIELWSATRNAAAFFDIQSATRLGSSTDSPAVFTIDPDDYSDGAHILFPVVRDVHDNVTRPGVLVPLVERGLLYANTSFPCLVASPVARVPVRVFATGDSGYAPARMRDLLDRALSEAAAVDPDARLAQITGIGLNADGRVQIDDATSYTKFWSFGFFNSAEHRWVEVRWVSIINNLFNPVVDPDAGNIASEVPFPDVDALGDSLEAVEARSPSCPVLVGDDSDLIIYSMQDGEARVVMSDARGGSWVGLAERPVTEVSGCP